MMTDALHIYDLDHTLYHLDEAARMLRASGESAIPAVLSELATVRSELEASRQKREATPARKQDSRAFVRLNSEQRLLETPITFERLVRAALDAPDGDVDCPAYTVAYAANDLWACSRPEKR